MRNVLATLLIGLVSQSALAVSNITYLSCPELDKRADDLVVVMDQTSSTASLQTGKLGGGLNFTAPAAFGPKEVSWRNDSKGLAQKYSVDRASLVLKRETTSDMTGSVYVATSPCTIVKPPANTKF